MTGSDPRTLLARPDLADARLEGLVRAARYAAVVPMRCRAPVAPVRREPGGVQEDQLLFGEGFDVLDRTDDWAWGQARRDGYVGFVRTQALAPAGEPETHRVSALRTIGFERPDWKSEPVGLFSMNALARVEALQDGFALAGKAGWLWRAHLAPMGAFEDDPAAVAERFVGAPYLWGGRDSLGLDCSGLVQQALYACGRACPRDADQQLAAFGRAADPAALERGDLVFWAGHVGMMLDAAQLIHANAAHMAVTTEPLADVVARKSGAEEDGAGEPIAFRRL